MCTALFAFGVHPTLLFFLAFNRDEFFDRPTAKAEWWPDEPAILAGRDLVRGGTWLGVTRSGRFAFLTNFREVQTSNPVAGPSRGELPANFLRGTADPEAYLHALDAAGQAGFNLVVGDMKSGEVAYTTNRDPSSLGPLRLKAGVYGISNGVLSSKWPKTEKGRSQLQELLKGQLEPQCFSPDDIQDRIMADCKKQEDERLPKTGMPQEVEREFSSIFIQPSNVLGKLYGTHTQTLVAGWANNKVDYYERQQFHLNGSLDGNVPRTTEHSFSVPIADIWRVK